MDIRSLGHSCFVFGAGGHTVIVDPFVQDNPRCPLSLSEVLALKPAAVLVSHAHGDHWGNTLDLAAGGAQVIATAEIADYAAERGANAVGMNIGGTFAAEWGRVTLTPAWHSSSFPDGQYGGMPCGIVLEMGEKRVYFAGDTARFGDMALIGELGLDAAVLPVGGHYTMGPEEAARCLEWLRPELAIPMHYGTFPPLTGDPHEFARLAEAAGVRARVLEPGEGMEI